MFEQGSPGKVSKDHKLSLSSVGREDRGDYICTAANTEGEAKQSLALNVLCEYSSQKTLSLRLLQYIALSTSKLIIS
jgi:hypothetical protein